MKICIFTPFYTSGYGTGYSVQKEAEYLHKLGHDITVVHSEKNFKTPRNSNISFFYFEYVNTPILNIYLMKRNIEKAIIKATEQKKGFDVFYGQALEFGLINFKILEEAPHIYFARSTIKGARASCLKHGIRDGAGRMLISFFLIFLEKRCLKNSKIIFVKSRIMQRELSQLYKVNISKIKILRGAIDKNDFPLLSAQKKSKILKEVGLSMRGSIILYVGRISPVKGIETLVKSFAEITRAGLSCTLLLVGGSMKRGKYYEKILRLIRNLNLENRVKIIGFVPQLEVYKYYNIADIVIIPSIYEPFGMVLYQALRYKKCIICTDVVGALESINPGENIKILPAGSVHRMTEIMKDLLEGRRNASREYELISWEDMTKQEDRIFKTFVE